MSTERVDKIISNMGYASRREVSNLAKKGKLLINGNVCTKSDTKINPLEDKIFFDGMNIEYMENIYIMLNKKAGYITATEDKKQATVLELLPERYRKMDIFAAGRLDKDTEGLLILTNDGEFSHFIMSPKHHVDKVYLAEIEGKIFDKEEQEIFENGILLEDGTQLKPAKLEILNQNSPQTIKITISEGKFHQVKRMVQSCGSQVVYLKRIQIGKLKLDEQLEVGEFRLIKEDEIMLFDYSKKK